MRTQKYHYFGVKRRVDMNLKSEYYYDEDKFVIKNYNESKTFSNFLPGVAGKRGIPLWAFYVDRAQGISGFGMQDKNHPIMAFHSANKAYETVATIGFRTFIKHDDSIYEAFNVNGKYPHKMTIESHKFTIEETNPDLSLKTTISYFGLVSEKIPALIRRVKFTNLSNQKLDLELLDGLAEILPAGISTQEFNSIPNLMQSWMDVDCLDEGFAFLKLRGSTNDSASVSTVKEGNFYLGFDDSGLITPLVDPKNIFLHDTTKSFPWGLHLQPINDLKKQKQVTVNKISCAFLPVKKTLAGNESFEIFAISGHTHSLATLKELIPYITKKDYIDQKDIEAASIIEAMLKDVKTSSAYPHFDQYIKQNYLDNLLRGGYPVEIGNQIYHLYSRRHGDLERDYNFFSLAPEYYSSGSGNFRDVCQNRRMDSFIHKEVGWFIYTSLRI